MGSKLRILCETESGEERGKGKVAEKQKKRKEKKEEEDGGREARRKNCLDILQSPIHGKKSGL